MDLIVIPSRWGSSRFPGKPLASLAGRSLLGRVIDVASRAAAEIDDVRVVVATDADVVADEARAHGCAAAMTEPELASGSERALAAARQQATAPRFVVNLQGDAPFVPPDAVAEVLRTLRSSGAGCVTPVVQLDWTALDAMREQKRVSPFSGTTCVRAPDGNAIWFSKQIVPAIRDEQNRRARSRASPVYRHLGLYGFDLATLALFAEIGPSPYERLEGLEQLRLLEHGLRIQTVAVAAPPISFSGIDTPEDLAAAERLIAQHGEPVAG